MRGGADQRLSRELRESTARAAKDEIILCWDLLERVINPARRRR